MLACRVVLSGMADGDLILLADARSDLSGALAAATALGLSIRVRTVAPEVMDSALQDLHASLVTSAAKGAGIRVLNEPPAPYNASVRQHYVEMLVARALACKASDIHIQPGPGATDLRVRADGRLRTLETISRESGATLVAQIKVLSRLPLAGKRLPLDGRMNVSVEGRNVEMRVSILPSIHGEAVVLRLDEQDSPLSMDELDMPPAVRGPLDRLLRRRGGMLLAGGPTGSGKTTTLYAMMREICDGGRKLISVEDPVERVIHGVNQVPVEPGGMGFGDAVRAMLRHSPDAILVGEIRDAQTAAAAAEAALTGHLVMASAHARDAAEVTLRLLDLGVSRHVLSCVLEAALTQRLVRLLCPSCAKPGLPAAPLLRAVGLPQTDAGRCRLPAGCPLCAGTGYRGRRAVFGLVTMNEDIRRAISAGAGAHSIRELARQAGMPGLAEAATELVKSGLTSAEEALVATGVSGPAEADDATP
jgi:type II secretory ATPase GspE/PulE/Tfp pilus assembly ATPase PilB-like protein